MDKIPDAGWEREKKAGSDAEYVEQSYYYASQWTLMRKRFLKHRLAVVGLIFLVVFYFVAIFAEFFAPYDSTRRFTDRSLARPSRVRLYSVNRGFVRPFVYGQSRQLDRQTFTYVYEENRTEEYPIYFFVKTEPYRLLGLIPMNIKLFGTEGPPLLLFGADKLGRDLFSRVIYGARISLFIGFGGVFISFVLGCLFGGLAGFFGGLVDEIIQRVTDLMMSVPQIPLWMALSVAVPRDWPVVKTYFAITLVLALVGWASIARVVRGRLLSLREEEYVLAARAANVSSAGIIVKHLLPGTLSYLIVTLTLAIPNMILAETALSFLGLGMQAPAVSWGVLLQDAQRLTVISNYPWHILPVLFVIFSVLMFNFVGDGLRDAADPYST